MDHKNKLGFQNDNCENMYEFMMVQLDSRASRMSCSQALLSLHADYIGGTRSNYKKWYLMAHLEIDENVNHSKLWHSYTNDVNRLQSGKVRIDSLNLDLPSILTLELQYKKNMLMLLERDLVTQVSLYLLIWGEANNVRFMPECICFIFKCALEYEVRDEPLNFLDDVVTPIYKFIRSQQYKLIDGKWIRRRKDHYEVIGYDDFNQFFWFPENLKKIKLRSGDLLMGTERTKRLKYFKTIEWKSFISKTYYERRSWFHLLTNFSRVWIIHLSMFWYFTSFNSPWLYTKNYNQLIDNKPPSQIQLTVVALGGAIACIIAFFATIFEAIFSPRTYPGSQPLFMKSFYLLGALFVNIAPTIYIFFWLPQNVVSIHGTYIGTAQLVISILTVLYLSVVPPLSYFSSVLFKSSSHIKAKVFTTNFPRLNFRGQCFSVILWILVIFCKLGESYMFLTLSLRDPIRVLYVMDLSRCNGDTLFGKILCMNHAKFVLALLYVTDLVLFILDTYSWYIILNCFFSVILSFSSGTSVFTPWKNIFLKLPERIYNKLIDSGTDTKMDFTFVVANIWNNIIISMYREHILSMDHVNRLIYQFSDRDETVYGDCPSKPPLFFLSKEDKSYNLDDIMKPSKEAERRISFFAQSLTCPIPDPIPTISIPSFTVLIPHYSEKIILNIREIIKEKDGSKVSMLDYLKQLNPEDWNNFVQDSKILSDFPGNTGTITTDLSIETSKSQKDNLDLPYNYVGFKSSDPEYTLRTRIWASLRTQTLYRTIAGFSKYETALKLLYKSEDENHSHKVNLYPEKVSEELKVFSERKFRLLVSLQRYQHFSTEEKENISLMAEIFPHIKITYLEEEVDPITNETVYHSTLLDLSRRDENGEFIKKFRIKLSGNPILGDGKSDNQNNALVFYRGEYIQVVDANQDNYLEECLKIKSVLAAFEEFNMNFDEEYNPQVLNAYKEPVAIIGAREYIFSENIGVLGDIAAAKEQTFGTLFARTLAEIGGKLHYGHPDFLNGIFMTTRGGISKAQRGLHLNEDIYAGMTAMCRGGRIKHCDYYQCGKGRDLGFDTVLNFTLKIGAGMGEQILSRDQYYLGNNLPTDRFLSFYYAHTGFHINNVCISLSLLLFMLVLLNLGALNNEVILCEYDAGSPITDLQTPLGCYNLKPVLQWIPKFVLSVFISFFISFLPLVFQEVMEHGVIKAVKRIFLHLVSLSPIFEVFVSQVYAKSLLDNLSMGGARYIATGRGLATSRQSFSSLFSRYAPLSLYKGGNLCLIFIFASITMWQMSLIWFVISVISICLAPIIFNPHQFSWAKFFLDYRELIRWFSRGNSRWHNNSWYGFQKTQRAKILGYKKRIRSDEGLKIVDGSRKLPFFHSFLNLIIVPSMSLLSCLLGFLFINSQTGVKNAKPVNPLFRICLVSLVPIILNIAVTLVTGVICLILGPIFRFKKFYSFMASVCHGFSVLIMIITVSSLFYIQAWNLSRSLCGVIVMLQVHRVLRNWVYLFLTKELKDDSPNYSWWSGRWFSHNLGYLAISQPIREFFVKIIEQMYFSYDFIFCHMLLFIVSPILLIPYIDKLHTVMLFWSKYDKKHFRNAILPRKIQRRRKRSAILYGILFGALLLCTVGLFIAPIFAAKYIPNIADSIKIPDMVDQLFQPTNQRNNDTGPNAPILVPRNRPSIPKMSTVF